MTKYIDADLLRKEIEFAKSVYDNPKRVVVGVADAFRQDGRAAMCDDILKKIDSLQQEVPVPNDLEEAAEEYIKKGKYLPEAFVVRPAFIAGAELQKQHDAKLIEIAYNDGITIGMTKQKEQDEISKVNYEGARAVYDNTVQHLQEKIDEKYELGKKDMKEQMLKEAMEGIAHPDDCEIWVNLVEYGYKFNDGDKVNVIIVKENEK